MKKLIGIIAAVAMAASVFALNDATVVSADIDFKDSSLYSYSKNNTAINAKDETADPDITSFMFKRTTPALSLSIGLGKVGASGKISTDPTASESAGVIWFKPFDLEDLLKVSVGNVGAEFTLCGAERKFAKEAEKTTNSGQGFRIDSALLDSKLNLHAVLSTGGAGNWWSDLTKTDCQYDTTFAADYTDADTVGTIKVFWQIDDKGESQKFGAGWTKSFGAITPIVNVIAYGNAYKEYSYNKNDATWMAGKKADGLAGIIIEPSVKGNMDPLTWGVYIPVVFDFEDMSNSKAWKDCLNDSATPQATKDTIAIWSQPKIGFDANVGYKIADDGYLTNAWFNVGSDNVAAWNNLVELKFEAGVKGKISDSTSWSLTVDPTFGKITADSKKIKATDDNTAKTDDYVDSLFNIKITPKVEGTYGGMSWSLAVEFTTGRFYTGNLVGQSVVLGTNTKTDINVPFKLAISF